MIPRLCTFLACICIVLFLSLSTHVASDSTESSSTSASASKDRKPALKVPSGILDRGFFSSQTDEWLNQFLEERGVPCVACLRPHLISLALDSQHMPLVRFMRKEEPVRKKDPQFSTIDPNSPQFETMMERMLDRDQARKHNQVLKDLINQGFDVSEVMKPKSEMGEMMQRARDLREKAHTEKTLLEKKNREARRIRREERKRKALERAMKLKQKTTETSDEKRTETENTEKSTTVKSEL